MARIVLSTIGSLGDLNPMIALAIELRKRGHVPVINTWQGYEEKIADLGFEFWPIRPNVDVEDRELLREIMDARKGPEKIVREIISPHLHEM